MSYEKIVLVTRKTRLEELVERFNTRAQAQFYIDHSGGDFSFYEREHETYVTAVERLRLSLSRLVKLQVIERHFLPNYLFAETDLVVTVGIDGLVVNTAKYLTGQPLVAVNPDPAHIDGILLPFSVESSETAVRSVLSGKFKSRAVSMAEARLNDGQSLLAFNDLFIGIRDHTSARYLLRYGERQERQSSSGLIVSTGAGSTGWLSSLWNMTRGIVKGFGDQTSAGSLDFPKLNWESDQLVFVVREPFISKTSGASIVCGSIVPGSPLRIESHMPEGGVIFSDGVQNDYVTFNAGAIATIGLASQKTLLVVQAH